MDFHNREELLTEMFNNSEDGIVYYKALRNETGELIDLVFEYVSDSALNYINGTVDDYLGKKFLTLFPGSKTGGMWEAFTNTLETGKPSSNVYWYEDEHYKGWYKDSIIKYGDGLIVYFRDETEKINLYETLRKNNEQLEKLLKENSLLLQETHHRIKNNLQIVASLLSLQSHKSSTTHESELLETAKQRIRTMAALHERLYFDRNYRTINLEQFVFDIIRTIEDNGISKERKIDYKVNVVNSEFNINTCVNVGLILNELLTNCQKHAFNDREKGEITINISKSGQNLEVFLCDNGIGLPSGYDMSESDSLGLTLVQSLTEQMDGKLTITSDKSGTSFSILIPHVQ